MLFNSGKFLLFFPCAVIVYFVLPKKLKCIWLLACSYYFYMAWNPVYILLLISSTLVTYLSGIILDKLKKDGTQKSRKTVVTVCAVINLGFLIFFKYMGFLTYLTDRFLTGVLHLKPVLTGIIPEILLPVGISFYTFQALSYTIDVYRGKAEAEHNIVRYALFVSFFPQLVAGPIERSENLLSQIQNIEKKKLWDYDSIIRGLILMIWGFFMKVVIADRLSIIVDAVFDDQFCYGASLRILAAFAFSLQIYCDFAGYSTIAIGAARIMGISLMENFNTPYFARNIKDFWNRWHISLSTWFRDYLYFPLGGSRVSKRRNYFNLMVTFLISGLWHGAAAKFVVWGGLNGALQILNRAFKPVRDTLIKKGLIRENGLLKYLEVVITFIMATLTWIVFRANSLKLAAEYVAHMITRPDYGLFFREHIYRNLVSDRDLIITMIAIFILFLAGLIRKKKGMTLDQYLLKKSYPIRAAVMMFLVFYILMFGQYGEDVYSKPFVYFQF